MKTSSAKAKGRKLQNWVRDQLISIFQELNADGLDLREEITTAIMGEKGEDVKLSSSVRHLFPFSIECKNQEKFTSIYNIMDQAKSHNDYEPLAFIKMNNKKPLIILDAEYFMKLYHHE
ncbi:MAG: hypothetical protein CML19_00475 [Pusillimonas sp.]|nr:hypothetical protein [Pusillimonas sp.]|tara:strand:- start:9630 stop:9986 length:357 start_codon:yes stop_codon:yes gene_type:complete